MRAGADQFPERPAIAVVIAERGRGHDLPAGKDHKLLHQPAAEGSGVHLDALPCCGEDSGDGRLAGRNRGPELQLGGDPAVLPGQAVIIGVAEVAVLDVVIGLQPGHGLEEAGAGPGRVEHKNAAGVRVHQEARITVAVEATAGPHHLLPSPGPAVVRAAPEQKVDRAGQVIEIGAPIVGGEHSALPGDGEGRDPVLAVAAGSPEREDVFSVRRGSQHRQDVGCHISMVGIVLNAAWRGCFSGRV